MAMTKRKRIIRAGRKKKSLGVSKKRGMKENKLNRIGIVLSLDIAGTKVRNYLPEIIA
jgi:hypothetical protein